MAIYPLKTNSPVLIVEVERNGQRMKARTTDRLKAVQIEHTMKAGLWKAPKALKATEVLTVKWLMNTSQGRLKGLKNETQAIKNLELACEIVGLDRDIRSITTKDYDRMSQVLSKRDGRKAGTKLGLTTINRYYAALSGALQWAYERQHIASVPMCPRTKEVPTRFAWLSEAEELKLLGWLRDNHYTREADCMAFMVATGFRVSELLGLTTSSLDFITGHNRGLCYARLWEDQTKTSTSRSMPVPEALGRTIERLLVQGELPPYHKLRIALREAVRALKMDQALTLHSLRHTTASRLASKGVIAEVRMKALGHKSFKTTQRYTHLEDDSLDKLVDLLKPVGA